MCVVEPVATLAAILAIDIRAYAVLSNPSHLMLRADKDKAAALRPAWLIARWARSFACGLHRSALKTSQSETQQAEQEIEQSHPPDRYTLPCAPPQ